MTKVGRVLLVTCGEEAIHALDIATGEDVWRFAERGCFQFKPLVSNETVIAASVRGRREGALFAIDLYSGQPRWQRELQGPPTSDPCAAANVALVSTAGEEATLSAHCLQTGRALWDTKDPGLGIGGAGLTFDDTWIVNAPFGQLSALDVHSGNIRWNTNLADALADEIPRRLEPVLRGGALFVPASSVHVVRPADGQKLSASLPCDLVPPRPRSHAGRRTRLGLHRRGKRLPRRLRAEAHAHAGQGRRPVTDCLGDPGRARGPSVGPAPPPPRYRLATRLARSGTPSTSLRRLGCSGCRSTR